MEQTEGSCGTLNAQTLRQLHGTEILQVPGMAEAHSLHCLLHVVRKGKRLQGIHFLAGKWRVGFDFGMGVKWDVPKG